jgi:hypothetical protein
MATSDETDRGQDHLERNRLQALLQRLSDADLARPLDDGWTISATLAHLAFWDRRAALLVERWLRDGSAPGPSDLIPDIDTLNEAALPQWRAISPRAAATEALAAAEAADLALDRASPALIEQIVAAGRPINPARARHRREHIDQIERALTAS